MEDEFDIAVGIDTVSGTVFCGLQQLKLRFPVPQDVLLEARNLTYLADRIVEFFDAEMFHMPSVG